MAQSGYTPIQLYLSTTASAVPLAANLAAGELAINTNDGKLYYKNSAGVVTLLAGAGGAGIAAGSNTQIQFNNSGAFGASSNLTWSGTVLATTGLTATGAITLNTTTNNQSYTTTGAGTITISSGTAGSINNMNIGATTAGTGKFTSLTNSGLTTGRVVYSTTGGLETDSAGLTFDGTNFATTGTATAAKLIPTGSSATGNGLYLPAANALGLSTNGTNAVYIDSTQNVGIGTSSPGVKLDVSGVIRSTGTSAILAFSKRSTGTGDAWGMYSQSGEYNIYDYTAGVSRLVIDSSGNVGIGTSSPAAKLHVYTGSITDTSLFVNNSYTGSSGGIQITQKSTGEGQLFTFNAQPLLFGTSNTERMRIDSSGNVGVGTSSPGTKLDVAGNIRLSAGSPVVQFNNGGPQIYVTAANTLQFSINSGSSEAMRIDSSGNVGIGTSSPSSRLAVNGGTSTSQIRWEVNNAAFTQEVSTNAAANAYVYKSNDASYHVWKISSSEAMRIDSSGNVGIGASSPARKLDVRNTSADYQLHLGDSASTVLGYELGRENTGGLFKFYGNQTGATGYIFSGIDGERMRIDSSGNVLVTNPAGLGYGTGSGGTVTQATSKSTAVTLNKPTGKITMNNASLVASGVVEFVFNNSLATNNDLILLTLGDQSGAYGNYNVWGGTFSGGGGFYINVKNISGSSLSDALVINFAIIKGTTS